MNGFIDSDVFLIRWGFVDTRIFQTGIVMLYIPSLLLLGAHLYEKGTGRSPYTRVSLLIVLIALSHMLMDTIEGGEPVYLYYPFSLTRYAFNKELVPLVIIFFGLLVLFGNIAETYMYVNNEERKDDDGWGFRRVLVDYRAAMGDMKEKITARFRRE